MNHKSFDNFLSIATGSVSGGVLSTKIHLLANMPMINAFLLGAAGAAGGWLGKEICVFFYNKLKSKTITK